MPGLLIERTTTTTAPCKRDCINEMSSLSPSPSPSPSPRPTIHSRRTLSSSLRRSGSQSPPTLPGLGISNISKPVEKEEEIEMEIEIPEKEESDKECWSRMLKLQRMFHCYNSARLEAAVEALEMGWGEDVVRMPSRLCLDLLNEQLREKMRIWSAL